METKEPNNRRNQGQRHRRTGEPMEIDRRKNTVPLLRKVRSFAKRCRRKLGIMSEMWESRTSSRNCTRTKNQMSRSNSGGRKDRTEQQGFVEDL